LKLESVGEVIATRSLTLVRNEVESEKIEVTLGKPFQDGENFLCPYQISGFGRNKIIAIGGIDAAPGHATGSEHDRS